MDVGRVVNPRFAGAVIFGFGNLETARRIPGVNAVGVVLVQLVIVRPKVDIRVLVRGYPIDTLGFGNLDVVRTVRSKIFGNRVVPQIKRVLVVRNFGRVDWTIPRKDHVYRRPDRREVTGKDETSSHYVVIEPTEGKLLDIAVSIENVILFIFPEVIETYDTHPGVLVLEFEGLGNGIGVMKRGNVERKRLEVDFRHCGLVNLVILQIRAGLLNPKRPGTESVGGRKFENLPIVSIYGNDF